MTLQIADIVNIGSSRFFTRTCPPLPPAEFIRKPVIQQPRASNNWRGYSATWRIRSGRLHLVGLRGLTLRMGKRGPHFADWVDEMVLQLPLGQVRRELGHRYSPVFEADLELRIRDGAITDWRLFRNPCKRRPKWQPGFPWPEIRLLLATENLLP